MYQLVIVFIALLTFFALVKPRCTKTENPFTGPKFSWGFATIYSILMTAIIGAGYYYLVGFTKPQQNEGDDKEKSVLELLRQEEDPTPTNTSYSTEAAKIDRLALRPFSV